MASTGVKLSIDPATQLNPSPRKWKASPADNPDHGVEDDSRDGIQPKEGRYSKGHDGTSSQTSGPQPMSKNQLKRLKRQQRWEDRKEDRKRRRKEKRHDRQARKRTEHEAKIAEAEAAGLDTREVFGAAKPGRVLQTTVPITFIIDCGFEEYMREMELVSLASQIVRCYSQNRQARHQAHMYVSSWKGKIRERFETVLANTHKNWKGVGFVDGDYEEAAKEALGVMRGPGGGQIVDFMRPRTESEARDKSDLTPIPEPEPVASAQSVVYLTAESPSTLDKLEPYTSYVIGGLVDRNREKGLCHKRATGRGIRTAKLPIGDYMVLQSRKVLATNHVVEILSNWLDSGDWGAAFFKVMPKRKGGVLREKTSEADSINGDTEDQDGQEANGGEDGHIDEGAVEGNQAPSVAAKTA